MSTYMCIFVCMPEVESGSQAMGVLRLVACDSGGRGPNGVRDTMGRPYLRGRETTSTG